MNVYDDFDLWNYARLLAKDTVAAFADVNHSKFALSDSYDVHVLINQQRMDRYSNGKVGRIMTVFVPGVFEIRYDLNDGNKFLDSKAHPNATETEVDEVAMLLRLMGSEQ